MFRLMFPKPLMVETGNAVVRHSSAIQAMYIHKLCIHTGYVCIHVYMYICIYLYMYILQFRLCIYTGYVYIQAVYIYSPCLMVESGNAVVRHVCSNVV